MCAWARNAPENSCSAMASRHGARGKFVVTTDSRHGLPVAQNLLARDFRPQLPNQVWTNDITYIATDEGWVYLSAVIDLFSPQVVGWSMKEHMQISLVTYALRMAWVRRRPAPGLIFHSDRGSQGGFDWSLQHLKKGGVRWDDPKDGQHNGRDGRQCARRAVLRSINGKPGKRSGKTLRAGLSSEDAAQACGVSQPLGPRWFREAGGMSPIALEPPSGRRLSFCEREEIALLRAQQCAIREIARRLGRSPSTFLMRAAS